MAEGEAVRTRLTALLRRNAAHPNSILPADDTITAQVLAIAPHTRLLRELDKLDKESHPVNDSYGYLVFVLINRILGVDRHTIRDVFAQVRAERARQRSGQLQLDDYGMDPAALGRKLA